MTRNEHGSFFWTFWAKMKQSLTSDEVKRLIAESVRVAELRYHDDQQAEIDNKIADAVVKVIVSLSDVSAACIRVGSFLLIKHTNNSGSVVTVLSLSPQEVEILARFPEIQKDPHKALEALALAVSRYAELEP